MDRLEIPVSDESARWLDALQRGDEVVFVRDGKAVAELTSRDAGKTGSLDQAALARLQAVMAPLRMDGETGAQLIRRLRDTRDF